MNNNTKLVVKTNPMPNNPVGTNPIPNLVKTPPIKTIQPQKTPGNNNLLKSTDNIQINKVTKTSLRQSTDNVPIKVQGLPPQKSNENLPLKSPRGLMRQSTDNVNPVKNTPSPNLVRTSMDNTPLKSPGFSPVKSSPSPLNNPVKTTTNTTPIKTMTSTNNLTKSSNNINPPLKTTTPPSPIKTNISSNNLVKTNSPLNNPVKTNNVPQKMMVKKIPSKDLPMKNNGLVKVKIKNTDTSIQRPGRSGTVIKQLVPFKIPTKLSGTDSPPIKREPVPIKTATKIQPIKVEVTPIKVETVQSVNVNTRTSRISVISPPEAPPLPIKMVETTPVKRQAKPRTRTIVQVEEIKKEKLEIQNQMIKERKKTIMFNQKQQQILEQLNQQKKNDFEKICVDCGTRGEDAFCGNCGGKIEAVKIEQKVKEEPKICLDCREEGMDAFCGNCGSEMVPKSEFEESINNNEEQYPLEDEVGTGELLEEMLEEMSGMGEGEGEWEGEGETLGEIEEEMNEFDELMEEIPDEQELELLEDLKHLSISKKNVPRETINNLSELKEVVIIELGSFYIKYGSIFEKEPYIRPSSSSYNTNTTSFQLDEYPIDSRNSNFALNNHSFDSLFSNILEVSELTEEKALIIVSSLPLQCRSNVSILDKLMDSEFSNDIPSHFYFGYSPSLSLIATSGTLDACGLIVEFGHRSTKIVPVYYGQCVEYATQESILSGEELLLFLEKMTSMRENFNSNSKKTKKVSSTLYNALRSICYVSTSFLNEMKKNGYSPSVSTLNSRSIVEGWTQSSPKIEQKVEIPDSSGATLGVERFLAGELFFQPKLFSQTSQSYPLHTMVYQAVASSPKELQQHLLSNIVLSGGVSKLPGLANRLKSQLKAMVPQYDINVYIAPENSSWLGAQLVASSPKFLSASMNPDEYQHIPFNHKFF